MSLRAIAAVRLLVTLCLVAGLGRPLAAQSPTYLSTNPYIGTPVPKTDSRISPYSSIGATNPYTTSGGRVIAQDGQYLGRLNANRYDPESVSNPYGAYGSKYSPTSINNPYSAYGSPYSNTSARNPYASQPPVVVYDRSSALPQARTVAPLESIRLPGARPSLSWP